MRELVINNNDTTLEELREKLAVATGVKIGRTTVDRMLRSLNLTLKKNTLSQRKKARIKYSNNEKIFGK